ncbi:MAG: aldehyde:ferredoxin oxidoreductase, partial [Oscillospiraceae bacterium]|nr:aldehyde:ferredoxin oxidoreductase [Oscillospiraceae bacterium]
LWGMKVSETQHVLESALEKEHGKPIRCGIVTIGPAGENLVRYASVMSGERAAGRGGIGAVFGSKNLKAVVTYGDSIPSVYDKEKTAKLNRKWVQSIRSHSFTGEQLPKLGTAGLVSPMQMHGLLSTHNYAKGTFDGFESISGEALAEELNISNNGCLSCPIRCSRRVPVGGKTVKGPELETLGLLGGNIENCNLEKICSWNYELDELGMDTISTAGTIAWAMEANEKGLWANGLAFGQTDNLSQVIDDIAHRRGIGNELAEGSKRLSEKYGGIEFAIHSKGMELAAYEPRRAIGQGLGYAVANRGGCHLNGGYLVVVEGLGLNVNGKTPRGKADLCMVMQDVMESISMGGQCLFTSYGILPDFLPRYPNSILSKTVNAVFPYLGLAVRILNKFPEIANFNLPLLPYPLELSYVTGMKMNIGKFIRAGERSYNVERAVNARFGVSSDYDKLPKRLTDVPQDPNDPKTKVPLEKMKKTYYQARGWQKNGLPSEKKLRKLGII